MRDFIPYFDRKYNIDSEKSGKNIGFHIKFCLKRAQSTIFKDLKNLSENIIKNLKDIEICYSRIYCVRIYW